MGFGFLKEADWKIPIKRREQLLTYKHDQEDKQDDEIPVFTRNLLKFSRSSQPIRRRVLPDAEMVDAVKEIFVRLENKGFAEKVETINAIREALHSYSPFSSEPVDCVRWVRGDLVEANDYNPNAVAPPEMKLLERSVCEDGFTQPIVAWRKDDIFEVVDGFHRNRVGKESEPVRKRNNGYLPITVINAGRMDRGDRIAATIRHNRARGKHQVERMSDIVIELKRRNWSEDRIGKELGMEPDEVLRLCQINGLVETFADVDFSKAWDAGIFEDDDLDGDVVTDTVVNYTEE